MLLLSHFTSPIAQSIMINLTCWYGLIFLVFFFLGYLATFWVNTFNISKFNYKLLALPLLSGTCDSIIVIFRDIFCMMTQRLSLLAFLCVSRFLFLVHLLTSNSHHLLRCLALKQKLLVFQMDWELLQRIALDCPAQLAVCN